MAQENQSLLSLLFRKRAEPAVAADTSGKAASGATAAAVDLEQVVAMESRAAATERPNYVVASSIDDILRVEEVSDADFFVGDLFRRRFHGDPPNYPRSFVAFYQPVRSQLEAVGFVHYLAFEDSYLCGGLVIDERRYRQMPTEHRKVIKAAGGIAEKMLRVTFGRLAAAPAIWGYVGDALAEKVDLRAGFRHTTHQHIMVCWNKDLPPEEKTQRLARVAALGPF
ncbi:MAG TPA: hypothetical protein VGL11_23125 [Candidatus Binatia bacterium]|jgi:hypothetical protein